MSAVLSATHGLLLAATLKGPHIDFAGLSPLIALLGGAVVVLVAGLIVGPGGGPQRASRLPGVIPSKASRLARREPNLRGAVLIVPALTLAALGAALGLTIWQWNDQESIVSGALAIDDLALVLNVLLDRGRR